MDLKEYIQNEFASLERIAGRVTDGLTQEELSWRPASGCNSIGLILFHVARFEDSIVQGRIMGGSPIWQTEQWYASLNVPEDEMGAHYTAEQVDAFPVPDIKSLIAYSVTVRARTMDCLKEMPSDGFDRKVQMMRGESPVAGVFALIVAHASGHLGEISYLRGMQRGMDK